MSKQDRRKSPSGWNDKDLQPAPRHPGSGQPRAHGSLIYKLLTAAAAALIAVGLYLIIKPWWVQYNQDKITDKLLDLADRQATAETSGSETGPGTEPNGTVPALPGPDSPEDDYVWVDPNDWVDARDDIDYFIPDPDRPGFYIEVTPTPELTSADNTGSGSASGSGEEPDPDPSPDSSEGTDSTSSPGSSSSSDGTSADSSSSGGTADGHTTGSSPGSTTGAAGGAATGSQASPHPSSDGLVGLKVIGKLVMDKIDVNIPLVEGLSKISLRYAAAQYEQTLPPGSDGNTAIFAHRSPQHGRDLNRLNEMQPGDTFEIVSGTQVFHYTVEQNIVVTPGEIFQHIFKDYGGSMVILVTCDPIPTWTHRMLCIARLTDTTG